MHSTGQGLKASPIDNLNRFLDLWIMFRNYSRIWWFPGADAKD